ncbi:NAD(P)-dependent oxidoreductase|uniref:2-hydroxymethylglutarate dehydrogenase n=1 Tax=Dendrosporobacter quercicolus TaxID=146817 RepID=A0A1G9QIY5_9FIRM|nr:NAD(P)-dependent oxidoreductase [Dendrosporobacter quercicolus]NSL48261.1 NAD(P)-dependent oxidoreductase [Dendrosporobacter quercicolus DSM 1736]SDM10969.1 2-hydroxymethylglutarate dehydrogenase [Dendrosporobacter quercicolus]
MKIGFIGLGAMGKPMALNLLQAGHAVTVCDINRDAVAGLVASGAAAADNPGELAAVAEIIIMMLPNGAIVEATVQGAAGILSKARPGLYIVDMSSVAPECTKKMAALARAQGVHYMDAPVSGGVTGAASGTLTIMAGGEAAVVEACRPVLEILGKKIYYAGQAGAGDAVKVVNNFLLAANMAAAAEGFVLGVKLGLDPAILFDIVSASSGNSYALTAKMTKFVFPGNFVPGFAVDLQHKDIELALAAAREAAVELRLAPVVQEFYQAAQTAGWGREDIAAIIKPLEEQARVKVRVKNE